MSWSPQELRDIADLKRRMGGVGEDTLTDDEIGDWWGEFSGWMDASWLIVGDGTFGCFTAYLIGKLSRHEKPAPLYLDRDTPGLGTGGEP